MDGKLLHGKGLNISSHQANADQCHSEPVCMPIRVAVIKRSDHTMCWKGWGAKGFLHMAVGNIKHIPTLEISLGVS